jgi:hypothetical protein
MNIEITYDPYEEAVNTGLIMGAHHKILPDSEWLKHIKRETGRDKLFVYHHQITGKFVLAHWIYPPWERDKPVCLELDTMDLPPDKGGWIPTKFIKLRCREVNHEEEYLKKKLHAEAEARDEQRKKQEGYERKDEMVQHLKKKGMEEEAWSLQQSKVHYSEEDSELKDDLLDMTKGKIITHA